MYLRLVEAYRDEQGRVRHRASFARLDPPPAGTRRQVGLLLLLLLLLLAHYLAWLGLVELVDAAAPMRGRAMLTHGEVIGALVANRLCAPVSL